MNNNSYRCSTWDILLTPGYLEQAGPENVFISDTHRNHIFNKEYEKVVCRLITLFIIYHFSINKIGCFFFKQCLQGPDKSLCIQKDELRVWSENAVKTGIKVFQSGGGMRV
jgi:hypothetical protein